MKENDFKIKLDTKAMSEWALPPQTSNVESARKQIDIRLNHIANKLQPLFIQMIIAFLEEQIRLIQPKPVVKAGCDSEDHY